MKNVFVGLFMMLALGAVAAECNDTTVYVWTNGPDKYADGTTVLDGERYALCWSAGEFAGFKADGSLVNAEDVVIEIASLAKDGKCRDYIYAIPYEIAGLLKGGNFSLWLLDTRVFAEDGKVSFAAQDGTKVSAIAGAAKVGATIKVTSTSGKSSVGDAVVAAVPTGVPADAPAPAIKSIKVDQSAKLVYIEVEKTVPYLTYDLAAGDKPSALEKGKAEHPVNGAATEADTITLIKPVKEGGELISVNRK